MECPISPGTRCFTCGGAVAGSEDSVHEYPDRSLTPHERLQELAWLVGEWVDEGDEGVVETSCHWGDDKSYLIRKFTMRISANP